MNADIDQDFREKIDNKIKYEITYFAGGIIFAESKLKIFNTLTLGLLRGGGST